MTREQDASDIRDIICAILFFVAVMCCGCASHTDLPPTSFNGKTYYYAGSLAPGESAVIHPDGTIAWEGVLPGTENETKPCPRKP